MYILSTKIYITTSRLIVNKHGILPTRYIQVTVEVNAREDSFQFLISVILYNLYNILMKVFNKNIDSNSFKKSTWLRKINIQRHQSSRYVPQYIMKLSKSVMRRRSLQAQRQQLLKTHIIIVFKRWHFGESKNFHRQSYMKYLIFVLYLLNYGIINLSETKCCFFFYQEKHIRSF